MQNKELLEYRARLLDQWLEKTHAFVAACRAVTNPHAALEPGGWNTHQIAAHVWDVDRRAYGLRIRRILNEDLPVFENYDGDAWMTDGYDPAMPLDAMLNELTARAEEIIPVLRALPPKAWNRLGRHAVQGDLTLQTWVERALAHVEEHLSTVRAFLPHG